jgi:hypothetical protein
MQRCRDRQGSNRPRHGVMVARFGDDAAFDHGLGQLLDEQRHAIGAVDDLVGNGLWQRLAASHIADHLGAVAARQAIEREHRHMRTPGPRCRELRPEGEDHQYPQTGRPIDE